MLTLLWPLKLWWHVVSVINGLSMALLIVGSGRQIIKSVRNIQRGWLTELSEKTKTDSSSLAHTSMEGEGAQLRKIGSRPVLTKYCPLLSYKGIHILPSLAHKSPRDLEMKNVRKTSGGKMGVIIRYSKYWLTIWFHNNPYIHTLCKNYAVHPT